MQFAIGYFFCSWMRFTDEDWRSKNLYVIVLAWSPVDAGGGLA
jgi:hypothetical protein